VPPGSNLLSNHAQTCASCATSEILARGPARPGDATACADSGGRGAAAGEDGCGYKLARRLEPCGTWQIVFAAADDTVPGRLAILPALPPLRPQIEVAVSAGSRLRPHRSAPWPDPFSSMVSSLTYRFPTTSPRHHDEQSKFGSHCSPCIMIYV
jgi:hypothetical protein